MKLATVCSAALVGLGLALGSTGVMAKAHDQGVADGTRIDPSSLGGQVVSGRGTRGIGAAAFRLPDGSTVDNELCPSGFCGVVGDPGQTYGKDIVSRQRELGIRRVTPVDRPGQNKPPRAGK